MTGPTIGPTIGPTTEGSTAAPQDALSDAGREARRKRRRIGVITWLAAALVLALALVGTSPSWAPAMSSILPWGQAGGSNASFQALADRLDAAEAQLKNPPSPASAAPPDLSDIEARLARLEQQAQQPSADLKRLDQVTHALEAALGGNEERLAALETRIGNLSDNPDRLLFVALSQLAAALESSRPFSGELKSAEALSGNRPEILAKLETLDAAATAGMPSVAALAQQFDTEAAPALLRRAPEAEAADESWWRRALARLQGLVVVRRVDAPAASGDPVAAAVAGAQAALAKGDLAGAVKSLADLPAGTLAPALAWLKAAQARLDAEAAVAGATQSVAQGIANGVAKTGGADGSKVP
ncbi:MAG TPA: hypothetical protein VFC38_05005 [Stellaceae bacterium]|nr:hypothetical protein [Stellaceae bacterium]